MANLKSEILDQEQRIDRFEEELNNKEREKYVTQEKCNAQIIEQKELIYELQRAFMIVKMNNQREKNDMKQDIEDSLKLLESYEPQLIEEKKQIIKNFPDNLRVFLYTFMFNVTQLNSQQLDRKISESKSDFKNKAYKQKKAENEKLLEEIKLKNG